MGQTFIIWRTEHFSCCRCQHPTYKHSCYGNKWLVYHKDFSGSHETQTHYGNTTAQINNLAQGLITEGTKEPRNQSRCRGINQNEWWIIKRAEWKCDIWRINAPSWCWLSFAVNRSAALRSSSLLLLNASLLRSDTLEHLIQGPRESAHRSKNVNKPQPRPSCLDIISSTSATKFWHISLSLCLFSLLTSFSVWRVRALEHGTTTGPRMTRVITELFELFELRLETGSPLQPTIT